MRSNSRSIILLIKQKALLITVLLAYLLLLLFTPGFTGTWSYPEMVLTPPHLLKGQSGQTEIAQDIYGFRALVSGLDPYANLHEALKPMGVEWQDRLPTTHPPTAFLLVAPVAFLPWPAIYALWAWLMVLLIIFSLKAYDFSWPAAIILGVLALFWPPVIVSLGNFPAVWMFGLAMAYHYRERSPLAAGAFVALASFTKLLPTVMLAPFLIRRKWPALLGFLLAWAAALLLIFAVSPTAIPRYLTVNRAVSPIWIAWIGNASPLVFLYRYFGLAGLGAGLYILLLALAVRWRDLFKSPRSLSQAEAGASFAPVSQAEADAVFAPVSQAENGAVFAPFSAELWHLFAFYAFMGLPIAWDYSIAPLLPGLLVLVQKPGLVKILGLLALLGPIAAALLHLPFAGIIFSIILPYSLYLILPSDLK